MNSLYGNMRTRTFSNIFFNDRIFRESYTNSGLSDSKISLDTLDKLYYQLYAAYGNSHIASSDETQFKYKLFAIITNKGLVWQKSLEIQDKLQNLNDDQITQVNSYLNSHAYNPGEGGVHDGILDYVNDQTKTKQQGGYITSYFAYLDSLRDVTTSFIGEFKKLFLTIVNPELPLWYEEEVDPEDKPFERILEIGDLALHSVLGYTDVIVKDEDIKPENIKKGVNILGVDGELETIIPQGKIDIVDTLPTDVTEYAEAQVVDANLVPANIRKGKNILGIEGSLVPDMPSDLREVTVKSDQLTQEILPEGFDGFDRVIVTGDANLKPENIKKDVSILGVKGTLEASAGVEFVDYIKSSGIQYFLTDIKPTLLQRIEITFRLPEDFPGQAGILYGSRQASTGTQTSLLKHNGDNTWLIQTTAKHSIFGKSDYDVHTMIIDYKNKLITDNGLKYGFQPGFQNLNYPYMLLAFNELGIANYLLALELMSFKVFDYGTGKYIADYVPCLDAYKEPCLFNKVNNRYLYNKGTGTLGYAKDGIVVPPSGVAIAQTLNLSNGIYSYENKDGTIVTEIDGINEGLPATNVVQEEMQPYELTPEEYAEEYNAYHSMRGDLI